MPASRMSGIPTSLRIAIAFVAALWVVGLMALVFGAPGEIVMAAAAIGTIGALVELTSDRWDSPEGLPEDGTADAASAAGELQSEPAQRRSDTHHHCTPAVIGIAPLNASYGRKASRLFRSPIFWPFSRKH